MAVPPEAPAAMAVPREGQAATAHLLVALAAMARRKAAPMVASHRRLECSRRPRSMEASLRHRPWTPTEVGDGLLLLVPLAAAASVHVGRALCTLCTCLPTLLYIQYQNAISYVPQGCHRHPTMARPRRRQARMAATAPRRRLHQGRTAVMVPRRRHRHQGKSTARKTTAGYRPRPRSRRCLTTAGMGRRCPASDACAALRQRPAACLDPCCCCC